METRYYIALSDGLHVMFKLGPGEAEAFDRGPTEPVPVSDTWAYPVSAEIAEAWVDDDE